MARHMDSLSEENQSMTPPLRTASCQCHLSTTTNDLFKMQVLLIIQSVKGSDSSCSTAVLGLATISRFFPVALLVVSTNPLNTVSIYILLFHVFEICILLPVFSLVCSLSCEVLPKTFYTNTVYLKSTSKSLCITLPCISLSPQAWLKVFAMKQGVVGIKGVKSSLYLCMSGQGLAYGAVCSPLHSSHQKCVMHVYCETVCTFSDLGQMLGNQFMTKHCLQGCMME